MKAVTAFCLIATTLLVTTSAMFQVPQSQPPQEQPPQEQPPRAQPPPEQPPQEQPPREQPPQEQPPREQPPQEQPPQAQPPPEQPPKEQPPPEQPPQERQEPRYGQEENRGVHWVQATKNDFPFLVRINNYYQTSSWFFEPCGGSIIAKRLILTAAHCYDGQLKTYKAVNAALVRVYIGEYDTSAQEPDERMDAPTKVVLHKDYRKIRTQENVNDIAVVLLAGDIPGTARTICLDSSLDAGGVPVTATGWGTTSSGGSMPAKLRKSTNLKTITNDQCKATGYTDSQITPEMICATGKGSQGIEDACQGDSGGPLFRGSSSQWKLVGVVSWGAGCADANYPGVYARVSVYTEFLKQTAMSLGVSDVCVA